MKKAAVLKMMPITGTHLFTPPSSDKVVRMSSEGFTILILSIVPLGISVIKIIS